MGVIAIGYAGCQNICCFVQSRGNRNKTKMTSFLRSSGKRYQRVGSYVDNTMVTCNVMVTMTSAHEMTSVFK